MMGTSHIPAFAPLPAAGNSEYLDVPPSDLRAILRVFLSGTPPASVKARRVVSLIFEPDECERVFIWHQLAKFKN